MALKHFSHYKNSEAAAKMYEVVSPALFEVDMTFPTVIRDGSAGEYGQFLKYAPIMLEHVRSISGLDGLTPTVGNVVQKYKYAERHYAAAGPDKTSLELQITYTLNLDDAAQNYVYNLLRAWYNLIYNPQNGQMLTKKQYAGGSILNIYEYDRSGAIWRKIKCFDFFPSTPPTGLNDDNYDSTGDAKTVSITFMVDDWVEQISGFNNFRDPISGEIHDNKYTVDISGNAGLGHIANETHNKENRIVS